MPSPKKPRRMFAMIEIEVQPMGGSAKEVEAHIRAAINQDDVRVLQVHVNVAKPEQPAPAAAAN